MQSPVLATIGCPSVSVCHTLALSEIMKSSPTDSTKTLVMAKKVEPEVPKGSPLSRALNESGVGKIRNFQPITRRISETVAR